MIDHFWRLRVAWDADDDAIRHAYHRLAREVHPDLAPAGASARERARREHAMARLNESFAVLEDPEQRAAHRRALEAQRARRHPRRATPRATAPAAATAPRPAAARRPPTPTRPGPGAAPTDDDETAWPGFVRTWREAPVRPRPRRGELRLRTRLAVMIAAAVFGLVVSALSNDTTSPDPAVTTATTLR